MEEIKYKLSICIPTYNRAETLEILLESIYKQIGNHIKDVEVCISDNASNDTTKQIVDIYMQKMHVVYYKHEKAIHPILNWNYVIDIMPSGKYVLMVGDDDIFVNDGIDRMLNLLENEPSDYYYLNHFHAQINVNREKVYNNNCKMTYESSDCECYCMQSRYVDKWEELLNYPGKDQEVNMLFIGNHLMKKGIWKLDIQRFKDLHDKYNGMPLCEETLDYFYSLWSPQVSMVATEMMGKKCYYYAEPVVCQGMGENTSELYQVLLLMFMPRWLNMFKKLNMDRIEFEKYEIFVTQRIVKRYASMLLYKGFLLEKYPFCSKCIYERDNANDILLMILKELSNKKNDYYYNMIDNYFLDEYKKVIEKKDGKIVLWGTGDVANTYLDSSILIKNSIDYVVDGNLKTHGKLYDKLQLIIHSPEELIRERVYLIVVASLKYEEEIKNTLKEYKLERYYVLSSRGIEYFS